MINNEITTTKGMESAQKALEQAKNRVAMEKKANEERRKAENRHKYMMGGVVHKYFPEEYTYGAEEDPTGKVVTGGSRLNVRTGAGMDYEIIDQLCPGEEVSVIGTEGDWYQIIVPAKTGYVHGDYLEVIESASLVPIQLTCRESSMKSPERRSNDRKYLDVFSSFEYGGSGIWNA